MTFTIILAVCAAVAASILALPVTMPGPASVHAVHSQIPGDSTDVGDRQELTTLAAERIGLAPQGPGPTAHLERVN